MHGRVNIQTLRTVLLVQSIEESDRGGDVLPLADRAEATRTAVREAQPGTRQLGTGEPRAREPADPLRAEEAASQPGTAPQTRQGAAVLPRRAELFLARRAELLMARVRARAPAVDHVLAVAAGLTWLGRAVLVLALIFGLSLSALDGSHRINILSFPLIGLIAWNFFVYAVLIATRIKRRRAGGLGPGSGGFWSGRFYERWIRRRVASLLDQSTGFNAPLATALRRFTSEWTAIVHPLLLERAKLLMHLAAALVAIGLIAGLYLRGLVFRYEAGWESTFLAAPSVHTLAALFYGPAAALTGIGLPTTDTLRTLRWTGMAGGGEAASWIHLIAVTAVFYIVAPRLILAALSRFKLWRLSRSPPLPASLLAHARTLLIGTAGGVALERAGVIPFAYEPGAETTAGLRTLLAGALGGVVKVELRSPVQYGQEDAFCRQLAQEGIRSAEWVILLMTLASTPEVENHGAVIRSLRDALAQNGPPLLVVIDAGPYAQRMHGDASLEQRLEERRRLWAQFVTGYGLRACIVDLARIVAGAPSESEARELVRTALLSGRST